MNKQLCCHYLSSGKCQLYFPFFGTWKENYIVVNNDGYCRIARDNKARTCEYCNWDWCHYIPLKIWTDIQFSKYPEWELTKEETPSFIQCDLYYGLGIGSSDIAQEWDNVCHGSFYYRDWTISGSPVLSHGELYRTGFWFQYQDDADRFWVKYAENKENSVYYR